jgi:hypothetical protein
MAPAAVFPATDLFAMAAEANASKDYYSSGLRSRFRIDADRPVVPAGEVTYADIGYEVDEAAFRRRAAARLAAGGLATAVPSGWPTRLEGPLVWSGDSFGDEDEYVYYLTEEDKAEIGRALEYFNREWVSVSVVGLTPFLPILLGWQVALATDHACCVEV